MVHGPISAVPVVSQVSLVHSSDSVRAIPTTSAPSTSSAVFAAPSIQNRMSKPPVRIVAQPPTAASFASGQHHKNHVPTMPVQPMSGRSNDEYSVKLQRQNGVHSEIQKPEVLALRTQEALQKVRAIKRQVADEECELRRLRELEHEAGILRERNGRREKELEKETAVLHEEQLTLRNATLRVQGLTRQLEEMYRRRQTAAAAALVEHRKMQQQQQLNRSFDHASFSSSRATPPQEIVRPRASVEPFQVVPHSKPGNENEVVKNMDFVDSACQDADSTKLGIPAEPAYQAPSPKSEGKREDVSPSPPKDPHPSQPSPSVDSHRLSSLSDQTDPGQLYNNALASEVEHLKLDRPTSIVFADSLDESRLRTGKTDLVSLRSDSLKATKRRSWAASEGTSMTEAETIFRLLEEQRRGRTHFIPQLPTPIEEPSTAPAEQLEVVSVERSPAYTKTLEEETISAKSDDETMEMEVSPAKRVKGILRPPNEKRNKGRIEFDPLALLLDAALEGELDLVKTSAGKLQDVSMANDEGITALHNAICAGHYEIVKFLIEQDADVNAQDSDGWTPLHCAASCNNLPMVRQLVEGGGCVLASTLSDMETPVEKCEEEEDGYDGCLRYLVAAHNATGSLNDAKVYAAYPYEAQQEDELTFEAGDELVVLCKDDVDKHWWTCRSTSGRTGLVPRTYVALYPALKFRDKLDFLMFDIPLEPNNNLDGEKD
ncbi:unnamed protein product [Caenorhabditis auriculariae]|uniref:SH3 domain-containing protein n=1 Tax=Caenorhabditis auriculariae TaxID=2777116 RepID=A0A8S1HM71_9PELO|nr:unnamed protein product [Caenorhabditis auriculariae]